MIIGDILIGGAHNITSWVNTNPNKQHSFSFQDVRIFVSAVHC